MALPKVIRHNDNSRFHPVNDWDVKGIRVLPPTPGMAKKQNETERHLLPSRLQEIRNEPQINDEEAFAMSDTVTVFSGVDDEFYENNRHSDYLRRHPSLLTNPSVRRNDTKDVFQTENVSSSPPTAPPPSHPPPSPPQQQEKRSSPKADAADQPGNSSPDPKEVEYHFKRYLEKNGLPMPSRDNLFDVDESDAGDVKKKKKGSPPVPNQDGIPAAGARSVTPAEIERLRVKAAAYQQSVFPSFHLPSPPKPQYDQPNIASTHFNNGEAPANKKRADKGKGPATPPQIVHQETLMTPPRAANPSPIMYIPPRTYIPSGTFSQIFSQEASMQQQYQTPTRFDMVQSNPIDMKQQFHGLSSEDNFHPTTNVIISYPMVPPNTSIDHRSRERQIESYNPSFPTPPSMFHQKDSTSSPLSWLLKPQVPTFAAKEKADHEQQNQKAPTLRRKQNFPNEDNHSQHAYILLNNQRPGSSDIGRDYLNSEFVGPEFNVEKTEQRRGSMYGPPDTTEALRKSEAVDHEYRAWSEANDLENRAGDSRSKKIDADPKRLLEKVSKPWAMAKKQHGALSKLRSFMFSRARSYLITAMIFFVVINLLFIDGFLIFLVIKFSAVLQKVLKLVGSS